MRKKTTEPRLNPYLLELLLMERYGVVIGGKDLRSLLGFETTADLMRAIRSEELPIRFFKIPRRRGYFAIVTEVGAWVKQCWVKELAKENYDRRAEEREKTAEFPLEHWFDVTRRISRDDLDLCEAEIMSHAVKEGVDPAGPEVREEINEMKRAVKLHNKQFRPQ